MVVILLGVLMFFKKLIITSLTFLLGGFLYAQTPTHTSHSLKAESRIVPAHDKEGTEVSFYRLTESAAYTNTGRRVSLAWDQRPTEENTHFVTLAFEKLLGIQNLDLYYSNQGSFAKSIQFIELNKSGKFSLGKYINGKYMFNPGIGFGAGFKEYWNIDSSMVFMISEASLDFKTKSGKSIVQILGGYLPLKGLKNSEGDRAYWVAGSIIANHVLLAYGEKNHAPIAHIGFLENNYFSFFSTVKFDVKHQLTSTWTHIGFGETKLKNGGDFFTKEVMTSSSGPLFEQSMAPFMWRYHASGIAKATNSLVINTNHSRNEQSVEHIVQVLYGRRDLGPLPCSVGLGPRLTMKEKDGVFEHTSLDGAIAIYSDEIKFGPVKTVVEVNYATAFGKKSAGNIAAYFSLSVDFNNFNSHKEKPVNVK